MAKIDFGGVVEEVVTSRNSPWRRHERSLKDETVAVLGYGVQGPGQALNMRDNGIKVIVGQREGGQFVAAGRGSTVLCPERPSFPWRRRPSRGPLSSIWSPMRGRWPLARDQGMPQRGDALYFSHGFSIAYQGSDGCGPAPG